MARRFAKVSEEEIEEAFFYPSDLVNTKTTTPSGSVKSGGYKPGRFASRYISTTIGESLLTSCLHFCSLAYDLPNRSSGRIYELNAKVERLS